MRDDRLPIVRILTALFFVETDYVTTLLYPYFLDFERGWILCIAARWNTLKPACTAADSAVLPGHISQQIGRPSTSKAMPTTIW